MLFIDTKPENKQVTKSASTWQQHVAPYKQSSTWRSLWQLANTFIPFFLTLVVMYYSLSISYWLTLGLAPLAAGFQLRIFIIFHDCCHLSFFKSNKANEIIGTICGIFCFTPYNHWRYYHALHHATTGNLTKRLEGEIVPLTIPKFLKTNGDVLTLTVKEYQQLSGRQRLTYRLYRWLLLFILVLPLVVFLLMNRMANSQADKRAKNSVILTNTFLALIVLSLTFTVGLGPVLLIGLPVLAISSTVGVWLFYIQHQFEETYWQEAGEWNYVQAALQGSSFYELPLVLRWFSGSIGYHHIHHLNPRIPNYNLKKCHDASSIFRQTKSLTLTTGLKSIFYRLWDEDKQKMVGFGRIASPENKPIAEQVSLD